MLVGAFTPVREALLSMNYTPNPIKNTYEHIAGGKNQKNKKPNLQNQAEIEILAGI